MNFKKISSSTNYIANKEDMLYFKEKFESILFNDRFFKIFTYFDIRSFEWKNPTEHSGAGTKRGFIAQELGAVDSFYTDTYSMDKDGDDYSIIHNADGSLKDDSAGMAQTAKLGYKDAMYVSVIKQLISKIETLETKVQALEDA